MSKESASSPAAPRSFSALFPEKKDLAPVSAFRIQWPTLQPQKRGFLGNQALRDLEEQVLKEAKEKALAAEKEAYEKGFSQGEKDGLELGFKRLEANLQSFQKILAEVQSFQKEYFQKHEREMVQFLVALVRRILRQDIPQAERVVAAALREAFQCVEDRKRVQIRLHPKDYEFLKTNPDLLPFPLEEASPDGLRITADPTVLRGGCLIETPFGNIDATLESQLEQITAGIWQKSDADRPLNPGSTP